MNKYVLACIAVALFGLTGCILPPDGPHGHHHNNNTVIIDNNNHRPHNGGPDHRPNDHRKDHDQHRR